MVDSMTVINRKAIELGIERDFIAGMRDIFRENLSFGFICGGFAKGYWDRKHDIDVFICVNDLDSVRKRQASEYILWYYDVHNKYGFPPDDAYPGEIVEKNDLIRTLKILRDLQLQLKITDISIKEAIIWADMIVGKKTGIVGNDLVLLTSLEKEYKNYPEKWKEEILSLISDSDRIQWKNKSYLLIMENFMKYPQNDAWDFYRKYGIQRLSQGII